ncbi:MAG: HAD hydrolase-like protein [Chloroflexota bacterium]
MKRLLLFDIDGTLVNSNRTGRMAVGRALAQVFGTAGGVTTYDFAGKTDRRIVFDLMTAEGWSTTEIENRFADFETWMVRFGEELFTPDRIRPCPGVIPLLTALQDRPQAFLGLLTGNLQVTAPLKLQAAGINPSLFCAGAYGSDSSDRNELMAIALDRVEESVGLRFHTEEVVILGDTPADIRVARAGQARAIAVATGPVSWQVLHEHEPNHLFTDFTATTAVLDAIFDLAPAMV